MEDETKKRNPAKWEFETAEPEKAALLRDSLREVRDPELGYNVIELGLIRNVVLQESRYLITMILTTPFCPYAPTMVEQVRRQAESVLDLSVVIDLRMDLWDESMMEEGFELDWGLF